MNGINKVIILGTTGRDPEVKYSPSGDAICNLSLATSRKWKDKSGDAKEETEWHRVVFYGKTAEVVGKYVVKGKPIYVEGRLKTRKWTDKDGVEKYATEIVADQMQLLGGGDAKPADTRTHSEREKPLADMDNDIPFN